MERARPADRADAERLAQLCGEAFAELSARRGGPQLVRAVLAGRAIPEALSAMLADPKVLVVAGELSGAMMGVGIVRVEGPPPWPVPGESHATVELLYVEPGARGVGLGEAMMDAMVAWAGERGCTAIDATALPGSREAKAFFETYGMVTRALVMHRRLPPAGGSAGARD